MKLDKSYTSIYVSKHFILTKSLEEYLFNIIKKSQPNSSYRFSQVSFLCSWRKDI
jgi:hypothetical protein